MVMILIIPLVQLLGGTVLQAGFEIIQFLPSICYKTDVF